MASCIHGGHRTARCGVGCGTRPRAVHLLPPPARRCPTCCSRALSPKRQAGKHPRSGASGDEESDTTGGGTSPPATAASGSFISLAGRAGSRSRYRTRRRRSTQPPVGAVDVLACSHFAHISHSRPCSLLSTVRLPRRRPTPMSVLPGCLPAGAARAGQERRRLLPRLGHLARARGAWSVGAAGLQAQLRPLYGNAQQS